ncbi:MAG: proton-conducting transporter membrane subunit [Campylobacterota bacterium]|nr:proton-conducting transporter membrane subunit [Campylobacterota bacterium]
MFNFEATPLGNLFFALAVIVFLSLFAVKNENRSSLLNLLLLASLGCIFYASDLVTFFIGWEVMGWSSYFIIAKTSDLKTLQKYIIFNLAAAFAMLGAIVMIYGYCGTFSYSGIDFASVPESAVLTISLLLLIAIFVKSGVMPFHYWVVDTYESANSVFSAILSAIISKSGVFAFILFFVQIIRVENLPELLFDIVAWAGVVTSIIATFKAIDEDVMKRLLAYSSIAQLGYIVTVLAVLNSSALEAGLYHTVIHTFVKLLLFINIAAIIYVTKKTKFSELGGLLYRYPTLFVLLVIGIITLAGMPPLGGFNSKFLIYTTLLEEKKGVLLAAVMFSSASAFLYCYKLVYGIYLGQPTQAEGGAYPNVPPSFYIPQILGAVILVVLGIFPASIVPIFNTVLLSLGLEAVPYTDIFELYTSFASFNGAILMGVFAVFFVIFLALLLRLKNQAVTVKNRLDISYCGEVPDKNVNLHYGYGMAKELRRISFIRVMLQNSSSSFWEWVSTSSRDASAVVSRLYNLSVQNVGFLILTFFTLLLLIGVKS